MLDPTAPDSNDIEYIRHAAHEILQDVKQVETELICSVAVGAVGFVLSGCIIVVVSSGVVDSVYVKQIQGEAAIIARENAQPARTDTNQACRLHPHPQYPHHLLQRRGFLQSKLDRYQAEVAVMQQQQQAREGE